MGSIFPLSVLVSLVQSQKKPNAILTYISRCIVSRSREVIVPFYSALIRTHLECCGHFWALLFKKDINKLVCITRREARIVRDVETELCEEQWRNLHIFNREKRRSSIINLFKLLEYSTEGGENLFSVALKRRS